MTKITITDNSDIGKVYVTENTTKVLITEDTTKIVVNDTKFGLQDAPVDGTLYGRRDAEWEEIDAGDILHNNLPDLQGGDTDEYYHLSETPYNNLYQQDQEVLTDSDVDFNSTTSALYSSHIRKRNVGTISHSTVVVGTDIYGGYGTEIWKIDVNGNVTEATAAGSVSGQMVYSETDGYIYGVGTNGLIRITPATLASEVVDATTFGLLPSITTDGTYLYVVSYVTAATIYKFDLTGTLIASEALTDMRNAHWIDYDGTYLYATSITPSYLKLAKIDPSDLSIITSVALPNVATDDNCIADGKIYIGLEFVDYIRVIDTSDLSTITDITVGDGSYCVTCDGTYIYTGHRTTGTITVIDPATNTVISNITANTDGSPNEIVFANDNIYWANWDGTDKNYISYMNKALFLLQSGAINAYNVDFTSSDYINLGDFKSPGMTFTNGNITIAGEMDANSGDFNILNTGVVVLDGDATTDIYAQDVEALKGHDVKIRAGNTEYEGGDVVGGDLYLNGGSAESGDTNTYGNVIIGNDGGYVGIGNATPTEMLDVTGNGKFSGDITGLSIDVAGKCEAGTFGCYAKIISRPNFFYGLGYGNETLTIDNYGNYTASEGNITLTAGSLNAYDITSERNLTATNGYISAGTFVNATTYIATPGYIVAGDETYSDSYYYAEGGYMEFYGSTTNNTVADFYNANGGDAAFGLRLTDNMFMVGTDYMMTDETGLNMNMDKEFAFGLLPITDYKVTVDGNSVNFGTLEVAGSGLGTEVLSNASFNTETAEWVPTGDFGFISGGYRFAYNTGAATLTQGELYLNIEWKPNTWYYFLPTFSNGNALFTAYIGTECADKNTYFSLFQQQGIYFKTNSNPGDFKIYVSASAYTDLNLVLTDVSVKEVTGGDITANEITLTDDINAVNGVFSGDVSVGTGIDMNANDITDVDQIYFTGTDIEILPTTATDAKIGIGTAATHAYQMNIGFLNTGIDRSVLLGVLCNAAGNYSVNIGYNADTGATKAVAIGYDTDATYESNIAIGDGAQSIGNNNSIAIGTCNASGNKSIAIGESSNVTQTSSLAIGYGAQATGGYGCVAIGPNTHANGGSSFAMGYLAEAAAYGMGLGASANSSANYSNALGYKSTASGIASVALGAGATTEGQDGPIASGRNSIAIGSYNAVTTSDGAIASGVGAVAIGSGCSNAVDYTFKVGGDITDVNIDADAAITGDAVVTGDTTSNSFKLSDKATITFNETTSSIDFTIL